MREQPTEICDETSSSIADDAHSTPTLMGPDRTEPEHNSDDEQEPELGPPSHASTSHEHFPAAARAEEPSLALRILRGIELVGLRLDYGWKGNSQWWTTRDEEVQGPFRFSEIAKDLVNGGGPIHVLSAEHAFDDTLHWVALNYAPLWKQRNVALFWTASYWFILIILGLCIVQFVPYPFRRYAEIVYIVAFIGGLIRHKVNKKRLRQPAQSVSQ